MILLGGLRFDIAADGPLTPEESLWIEAHTVEEPASNTPSFRLLLTGPNAGIDRMDEHPRDLPALIRIEGSTLMVAYSTFLGLIDPVTGSGTIHRREGSRSYALEATSRVALCCRLPLEGGLPLHAAGIVSGGQGVVFFGPSGAGKSTIAALSPHPVLSDELVVLTGGERLGLRASGFWGSLDRADAPEGGFPVAALIELRKGEEFALERLPVIDAFRRLIGVTMVPPSAPLWSAAAVVLERVTRSLPVFSMTWSPSRPPWNDIARALQI